MTNCGRAMAESIGIKGRMNRPVPVSLGHRGLPWMMREISYMTDSDNHLVRRWDRVTGRIERIAGVGVADYSGDGGAALEAGLSYPFGIVVDRAGHMFVADTFNHCIREIIL